MARFFLSVFLLALAGVSGASPVHGLSLERLDGPGELALAQYRGRFLLLSFYEPECRWCHRQMKVLERLHGECGEGLRTLGVGVHGRSEDLRRELRRARVSFPGVRASADLLEMVGEVPATPWTLVLGPEGELVATLRGLVRYEPLAQTFAGLCGRGGE